MLISVGRLDERKGHHLLLEGLAALSEDAKKQLTYVIVGKGDNGPHTERLKTLAAACGVPVVMTGGIPRDDIKALFAKAWMFGLTGIAHPQKIEGFGLVYAEAAAQGLPSLATPVGGVPEVVLDNQSGLLLKDTSPTAIAKALEHMLAHPDVLAAYRQEALRYAQTLTWDACARQTYTEASPA
jgi:glycosyltransferase involved in cell wall biosynthesis